MRRRELLLASGAMLAAPFVHAQASLRRVGYLLPGSDPGAELPGPKRAGSLALRNLGWVEGENLIIERAFADHDYRRLPALAESLLRKGVEVLMTDGSEATLAAARATRTVPIVFGSVVWPVEQGIIDSFSRPGRNATGIAFYTGVEVSNKRLELLREIAPTAVRLSWLWPGGIADTVSGKPVDMASVMGAAAGKLGFETKFHDIRKALDVEPALEDAARWRPEAMQVSGGLATQKERQLIVDFALRHRLPTAAPITSMAELGALLSYGPSPSEAPLLFMRFHLLVDRILKGAKPAELPVERPSKYELVINMRTARAIGIAVPRAVLLRADRVIE